MPKPPIRAVFANRLRAARSALGLSQAELGVRVGISEDVASSRVNRYERAVHDAPLEVAERMAEELGIPLPALVSRDDGMAQLIAGFAKLSKTKQAAVLAQVRDLLGTKEAEAVRAKLDQGTAGAPAEKAGRRRL